MAVQWPKMNLFLAVWLGLWASLYLLGSCCAIVKLVAIGCTSLYLADLGLKSYDEFVAQRENMKDVSKRAVLITGE